MKRRRLGTFRPPRPSEPKLVETGNIQDRAVNPEENTDPSYKASHPPKAISKFALTGSAPKAKALGTKSVKRVPFKPVQQDAPVISTAEKGPETKMCFSVFFTARSNKKRKVFDDGIIQVTGRVVKLFDLEGKLVTKSRCSQDQLDIGETIEIGSKEVEISEPVPMEHFISGKVFVAGSTPLPNSSNLGNKPERKLAVAQKSFSRPFSVPMKGAKPNKALHRTSVQIKRIKHSHTRENALVLYEQPPTVAGKEEVTRIVVDPILGDVLRQHQREGVQFLFDCTTSDSIDRNHGTLGCILADDMGLGKTLQVITLIWTLIRQGISASRNFVSKAVVVCPAFLVQNWASEFKKWLGPQRIIPVVVGNDGKDATKRKLRDFAMTGLRPVLIISYETYRSFASTLNSIKGYDLLVVDEGHRLKSSKGNQTIRALAAAPTNRRVLLTGTPVQNSMDEFFAMVSFVNPAILGSVTQFRRVFQMPIQRGQDRDATPEQVVLGRARAQELQELTQNFVLRRNSSILSKLLPDKVNINVFVRMIPTQAAIYSELISRARKVFNSKASSTDTLRLITKLKQVCTHPKLAGDGAEDQPAGASAKFMFLREFLLNMRSQAPSDRIVLVSNYTTTLDLIEYLCQELKLEFVRMDGKTTGSKRVSILRRFNNSRGNDIAVMLLSSKAGGCGLNLIGANRILLCDPDWNPATDLQAMARVWREGQKKKVFIYRLFATGTIEERILQRQLLKGNLNSVVDESSSSNAMKGSSMKSFKSSFTREELKELFQYNKTTLCHTYDILTNGRKETESQVAEQAASNGEASPSVSDLSEKEEVVSHGEMEEEEDAFPDLILSDEESDKESKMLHQPTNATKAEPVVSNEASRSSKGSYSSPSNYVSDEEIKDLFDSDSDDMLGKDSGIDSEGTCHELPKTGVDNSKKSSPGTTPYIPPAEKSCVQQWKPYSGPDSDLVCDPPLQMTAKKLPNIITWVQIEEKRADMHSLAAEYEDIKALSL